MSLFDILRRSKSKPATKQDLFELEIRIMATQAEVATQLRDLKTKVDDIGTGVRATKTIVEKVGTETDALLAKIEELKNNAASQDVIDALAALTPSVDAVKTVTDEAGAAIDAVDKKVPDLGGTGDGGQTA